MESREDRPGPVGAHDVDRQRHLVEAARQLIAYMPGATAILDREMRYLAVTDRWVSDYDLADRRLIGASHYAVFPEIPERWHALHRRCLAGESLDAEDDPFVRSDGRTEWIDWQMKPWRDASGEIAGIVLISRNVTERHEFLAALRANEARLARVFAAMSEGLVIHARDGHIIDLNEAAETVLGLTRDQILGRTSLDPDWRAIREDGSEYPGDEHPAMVTLRTGVAQHRVVMGVHTAGEHTRWLSVNAEPLPPSDDPKAAAVIATFADVTREVDDLRRIRELAQRLATVREEERRAVAHALHEGIAQELYATRLAVSRLRARSSGVEGVITACELIDQRMDKCLKDMRQIVNDLRPESLQLLRVADALTLHAHHFGELSGLDIQVKESPGFATLNASSRLILFRIAQEALTNIAKHAGAASVTLTLHSDENEVMMDVEDDGRGIADADLTKPRSTGLLGIQERLRALQGRFRISRNVGRPGTTLSVSLPLHEAVRPEGRSS